MKNEGESKRERISQSPVHTPYKFDETLMGLLDLDFKVFQNRFSVPNKSSAYNQNTRISMNSSLLNCFRKRKPEEISGYNTEM